MARVRIDRTRLHRAALGQPQVVAAVVQTGNAVLEEGRRSAPVWLGDYRDSLKMRLTVEADQVVATVYSDDWKAHLLEFGAKGRPTFATLRRAAESLGLPLRKPRNR